MKKLFAVFRNRNDLPEMTIPLVILTALTVIVSNLLAYKLMRQGAYGIILSGAMLIVSVTAYVLIILLWRKFAALAVTPLTAAALLFFNVPYFYIITSVLASLFIAYSSAVSVISKDTRYKRIFTSALSLAVVALLVGTAYIGLNYDSYSSFFQHMREQVSDFIQKYLTSAAEQAYTQRLDGGSSAADISWSATESAAAMVITTIPAYAVMLCTVAAWFCDAFLRLVLSQLGAIEDFIPYTHRITLPKYYAFAHIAVTFLMFFTSPEKNPLIYAVIQNIFLSMCLPCLYIGCVKLRRAVMIRLYFFHGKRAASVFALLLIFMLFGTSNFIIFMSLAGSVFTIKFYRKLADRICDSI